jgi:methionyl-tRNA formyltransferase
VVTKPRPQHHHGDVPVLSAAEELGLKIEQAATKGELDALMDGQPFKSRLGVLVDFGIIVSQKVIDYFPLGIVNSHFSILPEWRGADPITFAVLSGQKMTGVSLMYLVEAMDEGPLLGYGEQLLDDDMTTPQLTEKLIHLSDALLKHELPKVLNGESKGGTPQSITGRDVSYSRKLTKDDGLIDWSKPAVQLEREVRAFQEWPKSRAAVGMDVIITKAHVLKQSGKPGVKTILDKLPVVYCGQDALAIERLKPAGKKEMTGEAFLAGYKNLFLS